MPARAAISSRLAPANPRSETTSRVAAIRAARVRSRLPRALFDGSLAFAIWEEYTISIKYRRYILYQPEGRHVHHRDRPVPPRRPGPAAGEIAGRPRPVRGLEGQCLRDPAAPGLRKAPRPPGAD